ncbi:P-loop containing nucleoside triphosphate hydrolase protein [Mycena epipterygia]|nr:P-loop containing nucleoside triphosphate hydrolase protein [Mycena epipterygia]
MSSSSTEANKRKRDLLHLEGDSPAADGKTKRRELDSSQSGSGLTRTLPPLTLGDGQQVSSLRQHSRQEYLAKRELQQLELLRAEIADEEALFRGTRLSTTERSALDQKKRLLSVVEEWLAIDDTEEGYRIPDEHGQIDTKQKHAALYQRYKDAKPADDEFITDVDRWEGAQTRSSSGLKGNVDSADEYEYVFDESQAIDFIRGHVIDNEPEEKLLQIRIEEVEKRLQSLDATRKSLPIYAHRDKLIEAIAAHQILIIVAETGSGKTTQLPQYLHEAGYTANGQQIGCTQPRRVAAMSVAARVAEEMGTKIGHEVGYSIRFEECTSHKTVLKYMTDGILLREFLTAPDLGHYSALIIDEAHERTLNTDILFALIKDVARARPELRILISSATMDAQKFDEYFDDSQIFYVPGRTHPVEIYYTPQPEANYVHAAITTCFQIHTTQPKGDILIFLTGQDEIETAHESIQETARTLGNKIAELLVCLIYANLPNSMQAKIFEPSRRATVCTFIHLPAYFSTSHPSKCCCITNWS